MNLKFRTAKTDDLEDLVSLLSNDPLGSQREDATTPLDPSYVSAFKSIDSDPNIQLLVAEKDEIVVGLLQLAFVPFLTHMGSWRCFIEGVRIHDSYRGRGYGEKMFDHAINLAKEKGCKMVQLGSDKQRPEAIRFYEKLGFKATHVGFKLAI